MEQTDAQNYSLFFMSASKPTVKTTVVTLLGMAIALALNLVYAHFSTDNSPDSVAGYVDATVGSILLLLAAMKYSIYRRSRNRGVGDLNGGLNWHISFGILGLFILFLHTFGNFNPRTGTYALYGMIALVISGVIGKIIDRVMPRMVAQQVQKALTAQGEDKIASITQKLQDIAVYNSQELRGFQARDSSMAGLPPTKPKTGKGAAKEQTGKSLVIPSSWDLAYFSLDETPQEMNQQAAQYRFVPDRKSELARPMTYLPGTQEHLEAIEQVQQALQLEQTYRHIIRYWRVLHIFLAFTTIGLTLWHLEYALQLLIPLYIH
jgi:hypothetical protein